MATVLTDLLNSYTDGDIIGQGGWTDWTSGAGWCLIQGTTTAEGAKALKTTITDVGQHTINNIAAADVPTGTQCFHMRASDVTTAQNDVFFKAWNGIDLGSLFGVRLAGSKIILNRTGGTDQDLITSISNNTWYEVQVSWQSSDRTAKARARVYQGTWGAYCTAQAYATPLVDPRMVLWSPSGINGTLDQYVDTFQELPFSALTFTPKIIIM